MRPVAAAALLLMLTGCINGALTAPAEPRRTPEIRCTAPEIPDDFDPLFRAAARRWMPPDLHQAGWCVLKAQCWTESRLRPDAVSHAGAIGLCQVLESTAADFNLRGQMRSARANVKAATLTFDRFWNVWISPRTVECRLSLTIASYNAGPARIIEAQQRADMALCWERIRHDLPSVTGERAWETIDYVDRVMRTYSRLRGWGIAHDL